MAEDVNDAMIREKLEDVVRHLKNGSDLSFRTDSAYAQAIIWAGERIAELESQTQSPETGSDENRDVFLNLGYGDRIESRKNNKALTWAQRQFLELELENRSLSNTVRNLSKSPQLASPDSDEEIYERQERERLLDEITLICVRDRIEQLIDAGAEHFEPGATTETRWGRNSRDTADNICRGINEYDAE